MRRVHARTTRTRRPHALTRAAARAQRHQVLLCGRGRTRSPSQRLPAARDYLRLWMCARARAQVGGAGGEAMRLNLAELQGDVLVVQVVQVRSTSAR